MDALDALDENEVRPVFAPVSKPTHFTQPFLIRKLQLAAIRHVAILRTRKWTAKKACEAVADACGVTDETIKKWWKELGRSGNSPEIREAKAFYRNTVGIPFNEDAFLNQIKKNGQALLKAKIKKHKAKTANTGTKS
jgi:hypothetical protein